MQITLLFPHQLFFPNQALSKSRPIVIAKDPLFFRNKNNDAIFHKQKILLHLLSIDSFTEELNENGYRVNVLNEDQITPPNYYESYLMENKITEVHFIDPHDYEVEKRLFSTLKKLNVKSHFYDTPGFINTKDEINEYFQGKNKFFLSSFYQNERKKQNILIDSQGKPVDGKWSFDTENRKKLPKGIGVPSSHNYTYNDKSFNNSLNHINDNYKSNYGSVDSFNYPVSRKQAKQALYFFLDNKFKDFGTYEDAISTKHRFIFHSVLSPALNIGLLTPSEVVHTSIDYAKEHDIPINSLEGFIRQIIGWREFLRGVYQVKGSFQRNRNFWGFTKKIPKSFYTGTTGIDPVDDTIQNILKYAYGHHIERLMILGNIMCLLRYDPNDIYKWFMELFIDSYDWVMVPNVYGMSQYADGGLMSTKPYISGSNYILKMSDYKKGDWSSTWDALYWNFIRDNTSFFEKNPRMSMMTKLYKKKSIEQKKAYDQTVNNIEL